VKFAYQKEIEQSHALRLTLEQEIFFLAYSKWGLWQFHEFCWPVQERISLAHNHAIIRSCPPQCVRYPIQTNMHSKDKDKLTHLDNWYSVWLYAHRKPELFSFHTPTLTFGVVAPAIKVTIFGTADSVIRTDSDTTDLDIYSIFPWNITMPPECRQPTYNVDHIFNPGGQE